MPVFLMVEAFTIARCAPFDGAGCGGASPKPFGMTNGERRRQNLAFRLAAGLPGTGGAEASSGLKTGEQGEVIGHNRGPDVSLEVFKPAPSAAGKPVGAFQTRNARLDAGAEITELAVDPTAFHHVFDAKAALLMEGHVADAAGLRPVRQQRKSAPISSRSP